ncbi:MAG: hypothetical protein LUP91_09395 [Methylococcaceae bacterium]|nr:hypothetical protein [Methylococcaceae bacterium]
MDTNSDSKRPSDESRPTPGAGDGEVKPGDYLRAVRSHLRSGRPKDAFSVLMQAAIQFPEDPVILSYYGCLQAVVDKRYRSGVETCRKAIHMLKDQKTFGQEVLYPVFYLNLGRAYIAASRRKDAIDALSKGLKYDNTNSDLMRELKGLGVRKSPPVPFLDRSNPINKYIGMILHTTKSAKGAGGGASGRRGPSR